MAEGSERKKAADTAATLARPTAGNRHKRVGSTVRGKYTVDAFIATGTMANVYAATHRNGARVALKVLHKQLAEDPALCDRFKREGYFANSIGHPGIVRAIDDDITEDGCPFLVMELLEGETLEQRRLRKGGRLPSSWVLPIADSLLEILAAAHAREVVHRDLKPDNVFVTKSGEVKVLDFGVARWNDGKTSSDMTAVGMVLGTPAYMPPEQALGRREDVDAQSDIWAVGATLFVVLSGESVHVGGDAKAKLIATARTAARPLREAAPDVPRSVAAVIDRALAFHKSERWPDAEAMREGLRWARMSLEERPSQQAAVSSVPAMDPIPPPVETRRNMDDEPTIARAFPRDDSMPGAPPVSQDFLTSAPPITLRDVPKSTAVAPSAPERLERGRGVASNNEPVFSLRREKEGVDSMSPSTERYPKPEDGYPKPGSAALKTTPGIGDLPQAPPPSMSSYDPAEAIGAEGPGSVQEVSLSAVDVSLSFTRPMAAMVMPPEWPAPRPAAGAPPDGRTDAAYAATFLEPPADAYPALAPPAACPSGAPPAASSSAPGAYGSAPPPGAAVTGPPAPRTPASHAELPPAARSLQPETMPALRPQGSVAPGPMLSQIVKPSGGRLLRIGVPVLVGALAVAAAIFAVRTRGANARARTATGPSGAAGGGAASAISAAPSAAAAPTETASAAPVVTAVAAATGPATEPPKKKKPRPRSRPVAATVKPVESAAEPPAAPPTTTAQPVDPPAPAETTPKDALPTKDPDPKPAPFDNGAN